MNKDPDTPSDHQGNRNAAENGFFVLGKLLLNLRRSPIIRDMGLPSYLATDDHSYDRILWRFYWAR